MRPASHLRLIETGLVSVRVIAARYGVSKSALYEIIKSDPSFPYKNVGLKKKLMIDAESFEMWMNSRTENEKDKHFGFPNTEKLFQRYKK